MVMDDVTANMCQVGMGRADYARVLVEIEAGKEIQEVIKIAYTDNQKSVKGYKEVKVVYDWKPERCSHCKVFGHNFVKCKNRPKTVEEIQMEKKNEMHKTEKLTEGMNDGFKFVQNRRRKGTGQKKEYRRKYGEDEKMETNGQKAKIGSNSKEGNERNGKNQFEILKELEEGDMEDNVNNGKRENKDTYDEGDVLEGVNDMPNP